jgi:Mn2+/Fe2+ NRAMP family transporter
MGCAQDWQEASPSVSARTPALPGARTALSLARVLAPFLGAGHWLALDWRHARVFYGVIAASTVIGMALNFLGIDPIRALYYSAVLNGAIAPPLMVIIMLVGGDGRIMSAAAIALAIQLLMRHGRP